MAPPFVLVSSPLLPTGWEGVAAELYRAGRPAVVVDPRIPVSADPSELVAELARRIPAGAVLVPHSGAGLLAVALTASVDVAGTVFVDAALPDRSGATPTAPPDAVAVLAPRAVEGFLPPWTRWWSPEETADLFPDEETRDRIGRAAPRIPLAWLRTEIAVPDGWVARSAAYLAFGDTYAAELARARSAGWPTERIPGRHLQHMHDPEGVAAAILRLSSAMV